VRKGRGRERRGKVGMEREGVPPNVKSWLRLCLAYWKSELTK